MQVTEIENSTDDTYEEFKGTSPELVQDVLKYIIDEKKNNSELSLIDLIYSYCVKKNYNPIMVGEAISDDYYFKTLIANDITAVNVADEDW